MIVGAISGNEVLKSSPEVVSTSLEYNTNDPKTTLLICVYFYPKKFPCFWHLTCKNLHTHTSRFIDTYDLDFDMWCDLWRRENIRQLTCILLGMWRWGGILRGNIDVNWHSLFILKMSRDALGLEVEHQMKFVKCTRCWSLLWSCGFNKSANSNSRRFQAGSWTFQSVLPTSWTF